MPAGARLSPEIFVATRLRWSGFAAGFRRHRTTQRAHAGESYERSRRNLRCAAGHNKPLPGSRHELPGPSPEAGPSTASSRAYRRSTRWACSTEKLTLIGTIANHFIYQPRAPKYRGLLSIVQLPNWRTKASAISLWSWR